MQTHQLRNRYSLKTRLLALASLSVLTLAIPQIAYAQNNDVDGVIEEIMGEISIAPDDGGYSLTTCTNLI